MSSNLVDAAPRSLGSEFSVGPLSYGLWRYTHDDVAKAQGLLETALDAGMNLIDVADVYGFDWGGSGFGTVEELLGKVLAVAPQLRDRLVLASKGGIKPPVPYDSSDDYLREAVEGSLRRLQVDVIDVYQVHRPDLFTHPRALAETLVALRESGKIKEVGISNFTPDQYEALVAHLPFAIVSTQPEYSLMHLDPLRDGTFDKAMRDGVTPLAWSPLAGGRVLQSDGVDGPSPALAEALGLLADREGVDRAAIAVAFVLSHPARPVAIVGTQSSERIESATAALDVTLTRDDVYTLIEASEGVPLP